MERVGEGVWKEIWNKRKELPACPPSADFLEVSWDGTELWAPTGVCVFARAFPITVPLSVAFI